MNLPLLIFKNLTRNPTRTVLTGLAVAIPMTVFVMAIGISDLFESNLKDIASQLRLAVQHKVTFTHLLPDPQRQVIEGLDPRGEKIVTVCAIRWFGGQVPDKPFIIPSLSADADTFPVALLDIMLTPAERQAWRKDPRPLNSADAVQRVPYLSDPTRRDLVAWFENKNAAVVEKSTADYFGWRPGDLRRMKGSVPPFADLQFKIVKIFDNPTYFQMVWFRKDYMQHTYERLRKEQGSAIPDTGTNIFFVKCTSAGVMDEVAALIDRQFAHTPDVTRTITEDAFNRQFIEGQGNIPLLLVIVGCIVVAVISLAAANTMSMSFRERIREYATLKAIGFRPGALFTLVLSEGVLMAVLAGSIGAVLPVALFNTGLFRAVVLSGADQPRAAGQNQSPANVPEKNLARPGESNIVAGSPAAKQVSPILDGLSKLSIPLDSVLKAVLISLFVGLLAGFVPALQAVRLNTVTALRFVA